VQKIINTVKSNIYLFLLFTITLISHWYVFYDLRELNAGDWMYVPQKLLKNLFLYGQWSPHSDLGKYVFLSPNLVFYWLSSLFANISSFFTWGIFTRLLFLIPIVFLTPLFSFLFFKKIFKNNLAAFFSACIYSFNTFFLKLQLDQITYAFIWWILPALFLSIIKYLETKEKKYLIYNALLVFIGIVYEIRIMILVLVFLFIFQIVYLVINNDGFITKIKDNVYIFISYGIGILMHSFWLAPMKMGLSDDVMANVSPTPFISFYDILDVLTLHMYSWSHNLVLEPFIKQPIELRHFLIPIVVIIGITVFKKVFKDKSYNLYFVFFGVSLVIFLFLGKQEFSPFGEFYRWAFYNIPLFNLYRESSKFYVLAALAISFFFGAGLRYLYSFSKKFNKKIIVVLIAIILFFSSIFNLQHFFDQEIGGMTQGRVINIDYISFEKKMSADVNYYRILWIPAKPRFGFFSENHPFISATNLTTILKDVTGFTLFNKNLPVYSQLLFLLKHDYSNQLLDEMDVKYIALPVVEQRVKKITINRAENVNEIYEHYGERKLFIDELDKISYLKRVDIGTGELVVYENENYKPHIYSDSGLNYYQANASEFGDFSQNQNLYLNSEIENKEYLLNNLDNIIISIEADPVKKEEIQKIIDEATELKEKRRLQGDLDFYTNNLFFKDFKLKIPAGAVYKIYINKDSIINNNKNVVLNVNDVAVKKSGDDKKNKEGWVYFGQIELSKGEYSLKLSVNNEAVETINPQDIVFTAENLAEPIKTPQLEYRQIDPTKYVVNVHQASESFPLIFSESFHEGWRVYPTRVKSEKFEVESGKFVSENNQGTIQNENLNGGKFYDLLFKTPILDDKHFKVNNFANGWWVDLDEACRVKGGEGDLCTRNADGSYDFSVTIEFEPQKYFYIGLGISGLTLVFCLGYLIYDWRRRRRSEVTKSKVIKYEDE
jgi:hypothetical protein